MEAGLDSLGQDARKAATAVAEQKDAGQEQEPSQKTEEQQATTSDPSQAMEVDQVKQEEPGEAMETENVAGTKKRKAEDEPQDEQHVKKNKPSTLFYFDRLYGF